MYKKIWLAVILMMYFTNSFSIEITTGDTKKMEDKIQELVIQDTKVGEGRVAEKGLTISVHYTGWLLDATKNDKKGQKFDSSLDRREPFNFVLGVGQVIKGWDIGIMSMKLGEKAELTIDSEFAYGAAGSPPTIPANATLIFTVELLQVSDRRPTRWMMSDQELLASGLRLKGDGAARFKLQEWKAAEGHYRDSLAHLETVKNDN